MWFDGGSGPPSSPRLISKDGQLVFKPKSSSGVSSKGSTSIRIPIISSSSSIVPDYEDSRARGFVHRSLELLSLAYLYMGI
ncbi:hypothetical protein Tco_0703865 [Tanacetum coccineum]|uniref:Uncharacterized protein n=1 Tax=Tanacetum coccineum TaxID=301880 RepID=A0ABQ4Y060_9ASTR